MSRQLLFVQGGGGKNAHDEWDSRLVKSLEGKLGPEYEICYPRMPEEDDPNYGKWKGALRKELDQLDDGALLVGHSIGATILAHSLAEEPPDKTPAGIFLISMPFIGKNGWPSEDIKPEPELGAKLPEESEVYLYQGTDDETVPIEHVHLNAKAIPQAVVRELTGRDHQLNNDMAEVAADIRGLGSRKPSRQ